MPNHHTRTFLTFALALALLAGRVTDLTTGQPLAGVTVVVTSTHGGGSTKTDRDGRFRFPGVKAGIFSLSFESQDVPPQSATVKVSANQTRVIDIKLCSTTLDYHCGPATGGGGGG